MNQVISYEIDWIDPRGYVRVRCPRHPLADKKGRAPRHRVILYDHLHSPPTSSCHLCGYTLPWKSTIAYSSTRIINVDHLNNTPGDDRITNLAPSCAWCNSNRGWGEAVAPIWYERFCRWMADTPPWERPNLPNIVSEIVGFDVIDAYRNLPKPLPNGRARLGSAVRGSPTVDAIDHAWWRRLNGWATKMYGEDWATENDPDDIDTEFRNWLERRPEDCGDD